MFYDRKLPKKKTLNKHKIIFIVCDIYAFRYVCMKDKRKVSVKTQQRQTHSKKTRRKTYKKEWAQLGICLALLKFLLTLLWLSISMPLFAVVTGFCFSICDEPFDGVVLFGCCCFCCCCCCCCCCCYCQYKQWIVLTPQTKVWTLQWK